MCVFSLHLHLWWLSEFFTTFYTILRDISPRSTPACRLHNDEGRIPSIHSYSIYSILFMILIGMQTHWKEINVKLDKKPAMGYANRGNAKGKCKREIAMRWERWAAAHKLTGKHCFDDTQGQPDGRRQTGDRRESRAATPVAWADDMYLNFFAIPHHHQAMTNPSPRSRFVALNWPEQADRGRRWKQKVNEIYAS